MKKVLIVLLTVSIGIGANAQSGEGTRKGMPNIPGTFLFDYGVNLLTTHRHDSIKTSWFKSQTINAYYLYEFNITKNGQFTFNPGVGVGIDKFAFKNDKGIFNVINEDSGERETVIMPLEEVFADANGFKKSKLAATYIDVPMEIRYHSNPDDKDRSFKIAVGGRIGVLVNQKTKFKYTTVADASGETFKMKSKFHEDFNMSRFRYGTTLRMGIGAFNVFYYHNFSPIFSGDNGPNGTKVSNYTVGLTIMGF